ncbi:MAG: hypothetical protein IT475_16445, partial [Aquimonas sp.]|nr:hypothetical protein [Aquimonas sp.]
MTASPPTYLLSLDAVIIAVTADAPRVLCVRDTQTAVWSLPSGPLDPIHHPTMERGLRDWVQQQTGLALGYVEQLYTYGDRERDPRESELGMRVLSTAYLALVREQSSPDRQAQWIDCYGFLPWEDWRRGRPDLLDHHVRPHLLRWAGRDKRR